MRKRKLGCTIFRGSDHYFRENPKKTAVKRLRQINYRSKSNRIFSKTSFSVFSGTFAINDAFLTFQFKLRIWSARIIPLTGQLAGRETSKG